jgi:hypothetical protein
MTRSGRRRRIVVSPAAADAHAEQHREHKSRPTEPIPPASDDWEERRRERSTRLHCPADASVSVDQGGVSLLL